MSAVKTFFTALRSDEDGASFLEYTVLLGIILAVSITILIAVGTEAKSIWTVMQGVMTDAATAAGAS